MGFRHKVEHEESQSSIVQDARVTGSHYLLSSYWQLAHLSICSMAVLARTLAASMTALVMELDVQLTAGMAYPFFCACCIRSMRSWP